MLAKTGDVLLFPGVQRGELVLFFPRTSFIIERHINIQYAVRKQEEAKHQRQREKKKDKRFIEKATMQRLSFYFEDRSFPRPWQNDEHFLHAMPFSVSEEQRTSDLSSGAPTTKWVVSSAFVSSPLAPILRVCVRVCVLVWKCSTRSRFR